MRPSQWLIEALDFSWTSYLKLRLEMGNMSNRQQPDNEQTTAKGLQWVSTQLVKPAYGGCLHLAPKIVY